MSKIVTTYRTAWAQRAPGRRLARVHIVECESWPQGGRMSIPATAKVALDGKTRVGELLDVAPEDATCPGCLAQYRMKTCPACASGTGQHACGLSGLQTMFPLGGSQRRSR